MSKPTIKFNSFPLNPRNSYYHKILVDMYGPVEAKRQIVKSKLAFYGHSEEDFGQGTKKTNKNKNKHEHQSTRA